MKSRRPLSGLYKGGKLALTLRSATSEGKSAASSSDGCESHPFRNGISGASSHLDKFKFPPVTPIAPPRPLGPLGGILTADDRESESDDTLELSVYRDHLLFDVEPGESEHVESAHGHGQSAAAHNHAPPAPRFRHHSLVALGPCGEMLLIPMENADFEESEPDASELGLEAQERKAAEA